MGCWAGERTRVCCGQWPGFFGRPPASCGAWGWPRPKPGSMQEVSLRACSVTGSSQQICHVQALQAGPLRASVEREEEEGRGGGGGGGDIVEA